MSKYCTTSVIRRIKYTLIDEIKENIRLYFVYFVLVALGIVVGVLWGVRLGSDEIDREIINYIDGFASGALGIFSHFFDGILSYLLIGGLLVLALRYKVVSWCIWVIVAFCVAKGVRDGVYLILLGGVGNILCGVLFYAIYRIICAIVLSFMLIYIILRGNSCQLCIDKNAIIKVLLYYGVGLVVCFAYSILTSLIFSIIVV